jgi:hypothetical protein
VIAGALQPTSAIDVGAANRFIEHAIPDLSAGKVEIFLVSSFIEVVFTIYVVVSMA